MPTNTPIVSVEESRAAVDALYKRERAAWDEYNEASRMVAGFVAEVGPDSELVLGALPRYEAARDEWNAASAAFFAGAVAERAVVNDKPLRRREGVTEELMGRDQ